MASDPDMDRLAAASPSTTATFISRILDPLHVVVALQLLVTWQSRTSTGEFVGVLALVLVGAVAIPWGILTLAVRWRLASDRQVIHRRERPWLISAALVSLIATLAVLRLIDAPRPVLALFIAMATGILLVLVATIWTKASIHAAVVAGSIPVLATTCYIPLVITGGILLVAIMWARVRQGRHSLCQVLLGASAGLLGGLAFPCLA